MNLDVTSLYHDKVCAEVDARLDAELRKSLLSRGQQYYEALEVDGVACSIEITAPMTKPQALYDTYVKRNKSVLNRALVIDADFDPFSFKGIISISSFAGSTVMGLYKTLSCEGETIFVLNHSAEARRRTVIARLKNIETIERFFVVDKSIDMAADFIEAELKMLVKKSLAGPG